MRKRSINSSIKKRMNVERFSDLHSEVEAFEARISDPLLKKVFHKAFFNTILTTVFFEEDGSAFVITGDIPAMWLRDSAAQVMQYLFFAKTCPSVRELIKALLKKQFTFILIDPYANAFNREANGKGHTSDIPKNSPWVWERKFELDSLCYPLWLAARYYAETGDDTIFDSLFFKAFDLILTTFRNEQQHKEYSPYYHERRDRSRELWCGKGAPVSECGLVWSGYRPSDDCCTYNYYIPGNMFICTVLTKLLPYLREHGENKRATVAEELVGRIKAALDRYATTEADGKKISALETDGLGHHNVMDDANIPNLLAIPDYEYPFADEEVYQNTRRYMLSEANPYFYRGKAITGIGSPHTPENYVWPLSLIVQALTSDDPEEIRSCVHMVASSTGGTYYIHEGVHKDNAKIYTRPWFAWANSLFAYLVLKKQKELGIK